MAESGADDAAVRAGQAGELDGVGIASPPMPASPAVSRQQPSTASAAAAGSSPTAYQPGAAPPGLTALDIRSSTASPLMPASPGNAAPASPVPASPVYGITPTFGRLARSPHPSSPRRSCAPQQPSPVVLDPASVPSVQQLQAPVGQQRGVRCITFSPSGKSIATCCDDGTFSLWSAETGQRTCTVQAHPDTVRCVAFNHEGTLLASCSDDATVRLWDVSAATASTGASATTRPAYLTASSSMTDGAAGSTADGTPSCTATYTGFKGIVYGVAFTPEVVTYVGRRLPTKLATVCGDKAVRLWDVGSGACDAVLRGHGHWVVSVAISSDAAKIATGSWDKEVRLWTVLGKRSMFVLKGHTHWVMSVAFSPDSTRLASGSGDNSIRLWDMTSHRCTAVMRDAHKNWVSSVAWSPNGTRLASGSWDRSVKLWDVTVTPPTCVMQLPGLQWIYTVCFSPCGKWLAAAGNETTARVWDAENGTLVTTLQL